MSALAGREAIKAVEKTREANRARQRQVTALQREWVLDGELTAEHLIANRDRMRAECMARHPSWFGETA